MFSMIFVSTWDDFENKSIFDFCVKKEFVISNLEFINNTLFDS